MRIALLSAGPSLPATWTPGQALRFDLIVAVNRAGWLFPCDWLVSIDRNIIAPIMEGRHPFPLAGWVTRRHMGRDIRDGLCSMTGARWPVPDLVVEAGRLGVRSLPWYGLGDKGPTFPAEVAELTGDPFCPWTLPNALAFAQRLAAGGPIEVHGLDLALGQASAGGGGCAWSHGPERWMRELPWVRAAWGDNCTATSATPPGVLSWLRREHDDLAAALECAPPGPAQRSECTPTGLAPRCTPTGLAPVECLAAPTA